MEINVLPTNSKHKKQKTQHALAERMSVSRGEKACCE
jgi:hypothetical protein